ncbi:MAG: Cytochrome b561 [Holosporales bacterium]
MYTCFQKILHWGMAFLIIGLLVVGFIMEDLPDTMKTDVYMMHKTLGFIVLCLIPIRLIARLNMTPVTYPAAHPLHTFLMKGSVPVLYIMMIGMALSGFLMAMASGFGITLFGVYKLPMILPQSKEFASYANLLHSFFAPCFVGLLVLHFCAALYHHFILKDNILKRMMS